MFEFRVDDADGIVFERHSGFWSVEEVDRYFAALDRLLAGLGDRAATLDLVTDITGMQVQGRDVLARFAERRAGLGEEPFRRRALVGAGGGLRGLQARRVNGADRYRAFDAVPDAVAWLGTARDGQRTASGGTAATGKRGPA